MPEHFDWQTEDEDQWNDQSDRLPATALTRKRWKRWGVVLVGIIGLLAATSIIYLRVQSTLGEVEAGRTADILSSYQLIEDALFQADAELFTTFLSGADLSWAAVQQELFRRDWIIDRRAFGLGTSPHEVTEPRVELSPELNSAIVSVVRHYKITVPGGEEKIISLKNESVYRLGQRWLLSPPKDEYWGSDEPVELSGNILTLQFPERDQAIAMRLFEGMDKMLVNLCQSADFLICPPKLRVELIFSQDPNSFITTMESYFEDGYLGESLLKPGSTIELSLPTPTLLGLPLDEPSYEALFRAYAAHAAGAVLNRYTDDACCANDRHRQVMILNRLIGLGAMPWPEGQVSLVNEFALAGVGYDLQLMCHGEGAKSFDIYKLDSSNGLWRIDLTGKELVNMLGLPHGKGVALLENRDQGGTYSTRLFILDLGHEWVLFEDDLSPENAKNIRFEVREREQQLLLEIPILELGYSNYSVYDLASCDESGCAMEVHSLVGRPYWSPDGSQWLVRQDGLIWRHQGIMNVAVGNGFAPFWIDSERFGYVRQVGHEQFIVSSNTNSAEADVITAVSSLLDGLPEFGRGTQLRIGKVLPDPAQPASRWYILAFLVDRSGRIEDALVMDADLNLGQSELIHRSNNLNSIAISPVGGQLAAAFYDPASQRWQILIHGAAGEDDQTMALSSGSSLNSAPTMSWSPDGNWLAFMHNGVLTLWSSADVTSVEIIPPTAGCLTSAWILAEPEQ